MVRTTQTSGWFPRRFIKFDKTLQRKRKAYANPGDRANQSKIDSEIADIHNIMKRNIDEVLNRGERLDHLVESTSIPTREIEMVSKTHDDQYLRPPNTSIGERACCLGDRCICVWMARWRYGDDTDMAINGRRLYLRAADDGDAGQDEATAAGGGDPDASREPAVADSSDSSSGGSCKRGRGGGLRIVMVTARVDERRPV